MRIVRLVDTKHNADQKLTQPTAKDLEELLKNVLLGGGQEVGDGEGVLTLLTSAIVVVLLEDVVSVGGWVGGRATACTMGWFTSMQPWEGNLEERKK